ncbi:Sterol 3-beta-glucosyltransferase UGT80B1 [Cladobotryum mycophilum]|uniref:Sterol 3-beta-glucosyltransferase UGT80B1 n=1 Tax=Cladobotryum mycophilum TaxID=491253 RepID=A0ABR0T222_9HYPO
MDRIRSHVPSHVTINASGSDEVTSSVSNDGRFKVQFHDDAQSLATWVQLPRLNIAIHIVGSRGDVQPFIPIAQLLTKEPYNHRVRICTHPVFKDFVESQGIEFFSIGGDPEALMAYMVKNPGLLPNKESVKAGDIGKRREEMWEIINGAWRSCIEAGNGMGERVKAANVRSTDELFLADAIIANPPSMAHIHCAEKLGIPLHMVFTMPWSPTESFSHPLAAMNYGTADASTANYLSFVMMELLTWQGLGDLINKFRRKELGLDHISPMWGFQLLSRLQVPFTYLWSKSLIPKPADWGSYITVTGFSFLPLANTYTPPPDLTAFLEKGPPPIYIGFGSIVVDDPEALTELIFKAVKLSGVRAIVSKGWSGVGGGDVPENIYLIGNCPHDWLFQRMSAVVHHGGAGTTAAGIAAGRPTVVVPFFGDQPFWGQMVARAGAGPEPVPFKEMTAESLAASITFCLKPETQVAAKKMAQNISEENGALGTAEDFEGRLDLNSFKCVIFPERLATWKHKKTGRHLSGLAVSCLVDQGVIQPHDVKILHHKNWYVDEGAEHPLVGAAGAFTGLITAIVTATSDYSRSLKNRNGESHHSVPPSPTPLPQIPPMIKVTGDEDTSSEITHKVPSHHGLLKSVIPENAYSPTDMETTAMKMAKKSIRRVDPVQNIKRAPTFADKQKAAWQARERGQNGRAWYITRSTGRYAADLTTAGLKAPVAFFYNMANGFHNYPSYGFAGVEVRRRDQITGFGSGVRTAGKEFVLGLWDAFSGVVVQPYESVRDEGAKGIGKGIWRGGKGLVSNLGAAVFGLPGYTLKGVEKECSKRHLTKLKAELLVIRLRQGIDDFRRATPEERQEVITKWNALT